MRPSFARTAFSIFLLSLVCTISPLLAKKKSKSADSSSVQHKRAVHALNRLTFGPQPGDVEHVAEIGVDRWIDLQLHPEKISDRNLESRLAPFRTLHMSSKEILQDFPDTMTLRLTMDGRLPMPTDPERRAVYQVQIARLQQKQDAKDHKAGDPGKRESAEKESTESSAPKDAAPAADNTKSIEEIAAAVTAGLDSTDEATEKSGKEESNKGNKESVSESDAQSNHAGAKDSDSIMSPASDGKMLDANKTKPAVADAAAARREDRLYADLKVQELINLPPAERYKKILAMPTDEQVILTDSMRGGNGLQLFSGLEPRQKEILLAMNNPQAAVVMELAQAKLLRAIYGERQLEEVMTDFWFNHFNVFVGKGPERLLLTSYEQGVIRPHALGKFEDLLVATAKSPAMLFYLDNWMSVGPNSLQAQGGAATGPRRPMMRRGPMGRGPYGRGPYGRQRPPRQEPQARRKPSSGLNENYGRELLELHTLSVNGGYAQRDVTEVAKVFTGWTLDKPFEGMSFRYDPRMHEPGPKFVLGHRIKPKGEDEGKQVLHMLATSPQTARFISLKLAQRFISDDPPPALVDRMAKTFEKKKGDIREVLSTLFHSPEFWADGTYRAKVKTPLEFVASAVRATGANVEDAMPLARQLNDMGMPLYGAQPPTGYSTKAETWVSSSALLNRMNFALALTSGKVRGVKVDASLLAGSSSSLDASTTLSWMEAKLLAADVSKQTHDSIVAQMETNTASAKSLDATTVAGLLIGSPEFQRR